jgi:3-dehydroquinate dehydratase-2
MKFLVINGPNINMLGKREKDLYGNGTYDDLIAYVTEFCQKEKITVEFFQSNHEGAIVDKIQESMGNFDGIIINPAAYTHTSIAIFDALKAVAIPAVEVHISNIDEREDFRQISYIRPICIDVFSGFGFEGYKKAVKCLNEYLIALFI